MPKGNSEMCPHLFQMCVIFEEVVLLWKLKKIGALEIIKRPHERIRIVRKLYQGLGGQVSRIWVSYQIYQLGIKSSKIKLPGKCCYNKGATTIQCYWYCSTLKNNGFY